MGDKMCKTKKYLKTPKITPMQLLWVVGGIFVFIFMETDIFSSLDDTVKTIVYTSFMVVCVLLGVSIINLRKIALELKAIYVDKDMSLLEKCNAYGNVALVVLTKLGEAFQMLNEEQFKEPETRPELPRNIEE